MSLPPPPTSAGWIQIPRSCG